MRNKKKNCTSALASSSFRTRSASFISTSVPVVGSPYNTQATLLRFYYHQQSLTHPPYKKKTTKQQRPKQFQKF